MNGIEYYWSKAGFAVMKIHYSADSDKDPATPKGAEWLERELKGYPGGAGSSSWRQEMEIDWDAAGGDLVFPEFEPYKNKITVAPFEVPESWFLFGSYDYGQRNASSYHVHAMDFDQNVWTVWEFYSSSFGYLQQAKIIRSNPYWKRLQCNICDPQIFDKNQQQTSIGGDANVLKSVAELFAEIPPDPAEPDGMNGPIYFVPGKHGGDMTVAEWVKGNLWLDLANETPRWHIFKTCPFLIWELGKLRYADWTSTAQETKNLREEVVSKDNHAWDDFKYFLLQFMMGPQRPVQEKYEELKSVDYRSYLEWKAVDRMHEARQQNFEDEWEM